MVTPVDTDLLIVDVVVADCCCSRWVVVIYWLFGPLRTTRDLFGTLLLICGYAFTVPTLFLL